MSRSNPVRPMWHTSRQVRPKVSERLMVTKQSADRYSCGSSLVRPRHSGTFCPMPKRMVEEKRVYIYIPDIPRRIPGMIVYLPTGKWLLLVYNRPMDCLGMAYRKIFDSSIPLVGGYVIVPWRVWMLDQSHSDVTVAGFPCIMGNIPQKDLWQCNNQWRNTPKYAAFMSILSMSWMRCMLIIQVLFCFHVHSIKVMRCCWYFPTIATFARNRWMWEKTCQVTHSERP